MAPLVAPKLWSGGRFGVEDADVDGVAGSSGAWLVVGMGGLSTLSRQADPTLLTSIALRTPTSSRQRASASHHPSPFLLHISSIQTLQKKTTLSINQRTVSFNYKHHLLNSAHRLVFSLYLITAIVHGPCMRCHGVGRLRVLSFSSAFNVSIHILPDLLQHPFAAPSPLTSPTPRLYYSNYAPRLAWTFCILYQPSPSHSSVNESLPPDLTL